MTDWDIINKVRQIIAVSGVKDTFVWKDNKSGSWKLNTPWKLYTFDDSQEMLNYVCGFLVGGKQ